MPKATAATPAGAAQAVNERRLWDRHMELAKIGATAKGGCNRQALTPLDIEARRMFLGWAEALGFACYVDGIGNMFVRRPGTDADAAPVMSGSHLDTQPTGGRFDGIYGCLAALEVLQAVEEAGVKTRRPLEAAVWTNEEGVRFIPGCLGSLAFAKPDRLETLLAITDADGVTVRQAVAGLKKAVPKVKARPVGVPVHAFIEAHIEQGPILEAEEKTIGVVTGIQGMRRFRVELFGEDAHAGTTPRARRKDALSAAVATVAALERVFRDHEDVTRFTVGRFEVRPSALAVVPGYAMFTIDFRDPREEVIERLGNQVEVLCQTLSAPCTVKVTQTNRTPPIRFEGLVPDTILSVARRLGYPHMHIFSGAGHDAQHVFNLCPTGMIFVPCEKGVSHNESENATPADLVAGTRVLADVMVELANR